MSVYIKNLDNSKDKSITSDFIRLFIYLCNQRQFLNKKVLKKEEEACREDLGAFLIRSEFKK